MKKLAMICVAGLSVLAAVSCCKQANKVTAIVAGPEHEVVALDIAYGADICPESVSPEAFEVEGQEVACVKAGKEGHVLVVLKGACKKPCCKEGEGEGDKPCCKEGTPEGEKPCCKEGQPEGEKPCCKEGEEKPEGEKPCCKDGEKEKIAVPEISVKQVVDIKDVEGNVVKAWGKAVKASEVKPAHHGAPKPECCKDGQPEGEKPCCKAEKPAED